MTMRGICSVAAAVTVLAGCSQPGADVPLATFSDSASYAVGLRMAAGVRSQGAPVSVDKMVAGIRAGLALDTSRFSSDEVAELLQRLAAEGQELVRQREAEANIAAGKVFRDGFAGREGVKQTDSGILYEVLAEGTGPRPGPRDEVTVHYTGTLVNGTVFDSSRERGEPVTFRLDQVIPGWTQALQLMPLGSTYRIVIPPEWGYGEFGSPPRIGPEATLVFDVELLGLTPAPAE